MYTHKASTGVLGFLVGAIVWAMFGDKIKRKFHDKLDENPHWRESYDKMVDDVTENYAKAKGISQNELSDLTNDLKMHFRKIKSAWQKGGDNI